MQALSLPDVEDPCSGSHARVYQLALAMRRNFGIKLTLNSRVFRDSRRVDLRAAAEQDAAAPDAEKVLARTPPPPLSSWNSIGSTGCTTLRAYSLASVYSPRTVICVFLDQHLSTWFRCRCTRAGATRVSTTGRSWRPCA